MNFDTEHWNLRKSPTDNLPTNTIFIDLAKSEEDILKGMKPKTRYNIRLAKRKGVQVREAGMEELSLWYKLHVETSRRNGIHLDGLEYFRSVFKAKQANLKKNETIKLLLAEVGNVPLAGMFLALSGKRATYLYGASSSTFRNFMGTYALQWEAICRAKALGAKEYDFFGISGTPSPSHPMYGLYRFKSGFGGNFFHRQGCWDYPLDAGRYERYRAVELNATGYHQS
jgi:lipid II:glycine glycyltransferase (peptidoglycan interpeptide bridge formation enzyme)